MMLQISRLKALWQRRFFLVFHILCYVKHVTPPGRDHFLPQEHYSNKLGSCPLGNAKYQGSQPFGFRQDFSHFSCISLCKTCNPMDRVISSPRDIIEQTW